MAPFVCFSFSWISVIFSGSSCFKFLLLVRWISCFSSPSIEIYRWMILQFLHFCSCVFESVCMRSFAIDQFFVFFLETTNHPNYLAFLHDPADDFPFFVGHSGGKYVQSFRQGWGHPNPPLKCLIHNSVHNPQFTNHFTTNPAQPLTSSNGFYPLKTSPKP